MAIKISGTTVIDDSCNVTNANTFTATTFVGDGSGLTGVPNPPTLIKPLNTFPANGETNVSDVTAICGNTFTSLYADRTHTCSCFQVSECSDFSACNVLTCEVAGAIRCLQIPVGCLGFNTQYFFRLRYEDQDGCCTEFSTPTCFTTEALPTTLGQPALGGFYTGVICAAGTCYYLIVAPNSNGCNCCIWKNTDTLTGMCSEPDNCSNGYNNTYTYLTDSTHPAGNWARTRNIGGYDDWYLPSTSEMTGVMYQNKGCLPSGENYAGNFYWASTEVNVTDAARVFVGGNAASSLASKSGYRTFIRAVRRVPV